MKRSKILAALSVVLVSAGLAFTLWRVYEPMRAEAVLASIPATATAAHYADNTQCLGCHEDQAKQWQQSHHAMAMAAPTPQSVRGDFSNTTFTRHGITTRFFQRDGKYFVNTDGPDGKLSDFAVAWTFGVEPLQQYLIAMPGGRLQALQVAWDSQQRRWFHLQPNETPPPGDVLHWTGRYQTANTMCITCHTTGFEKNYNAVTDTFASRWAESNVSCQACHGPGERHVQWAQAKQKGGDIPDIGNTHAGLGVSAKMLAGKEQLETCASCHSRRSELGSAPTPGAARLDNYLPVLLTDGLYHADGQQLDEVFVDGSFRQSKMYAMGVTCTNCHNPHTGKLKLAGNAVCTQCHSTPGNSAFPTAARSYDSSAHHFHKPDSPGAQCVSCHMPSKTYMQVQPRPDHAIRVPRPDLSVKLGTPNACTQCHAGKPAQWAADRVAQWYGPNRRQEAHYGETFAAARVGKPGAPVALAQLAADQGKPAIVRATALDALRADAVSGIDVRRNATRDPDPEVRAAAADSFESVVPDHVIPALTPLLTDPVRAVRMAAARVLSPVAGDALGSASRPAFDAALAEYIAAQNASLDMPGARLNLAVVYANSGQLHLAEQQYQAALKIDPDFTPARVNLARLYNASARNADAERVLADGLKRHADIGELQYSLGLLLAEEQRLPEAADALAKAARLLPTSARAHYNFGLALMRLKKARQAEAALLKAHSIDDSDAAIPYALAVLYAQAGQGEKAFEWAGRAKALAPDDAQTQQLLEQLKAGHGK